MREVFNKGRWRLLAILGITLLVSSGAVISYKILKKPPAIPTAISTQLSYGAFIPAQGKPGSSLPQQVKYDSSQKLLTYNLDYENVNLIVSEQPTPESFSDVPQAYPALLDKLHQRDTIDTINGQLTITYPKELNGGQTAVMNSKGTLIFVRPNANLSTDQWRKFFNSLVINS